MASVSTDRRRGINASAAIKVPCVCATTANITLSAEQTIDGITTDGTRILVKDQTDASENGIYLTGTSDWTREPDFDGSYDVVEGTLIPVSRGNTHSNTYWSVSNTTAITIGTSDINLQATHVQVEADVTDYGALGNGTDDDTSAIQAAVDAANSAGGGKVYFPAGDYPVTSITMKPGASLIGEGSNAVTITQTGGTAAFDQGSTYLQNITVSGFTFDYQNSTPVQTDIGLRVRSSEHCKFDDLRFINYATATSGTPANDGQIAIKLAPSNLTAGETNCILNQFSNIWIEDARVGVEYAGVISTGSFDQATIQDTVCSPANVIVGNIWTHVSMWNIYERGIKAIQWADSEKWYGSYIRVAEDNAICIDLGTDANYFTQIDRFRIYDPNLEFSSAVTDESSVNGLRIGPGGLKHVILGIVSDDVWDNEVGGGNQMFDVTNAQSYEISTGHQGDGINYAYGRFSKGSCTRFSGFVTLASGDTTKTITYDTGGHNKLHRVPAPGEIQVSPRTDWGNATKWWISGMAISSFSIDVDIAPGANLTFHWSVNLLELD